MTAGSAIYIMSQRIGQHLSLDLLLFTVNTFVEATCGVTPYVFNIYLTLGFLG